MAETCSGLPVTRHIPAAALAAVVLLALAGLLSAVFVAGEPEGAAPPMNRAQASVAPISNVALGSAESGVPEAGTALREQTAEDMAELSTF